MKTLENKVIVVTGGNSGIGYAAAKEFIEEGATVVITGRNEESTQTAAKELGAIGIVSDQAKIADIGKLAEEIKTKFGKVDGLFVNAGYAAFMPVETATEEHFDNMVNVNVKGAFFTVQAFIPLLNDGAAVVFNGSVNAALAAPGSAVYSLGKAAILSLTKVLAGELAPRKIRVNAVSPGPVSTPLYGKLGLAQETLNGFADVLSQKILLHRFADPQEIAKVVRFLISPEASFITGVDLTVDGGITINTLA